MFWTAAQTALIVSAHPFWTQIHATFLSSLSLLHLFFSARSHFCLFSSGEALVCYLATVSMATEMLPVPPSLLLSLHQKSPVSLLCPLTKVLVKAWVCSCVWEQSSELFTLLPHTLLVWNASVWMDDWCLWDLHGSNMLYNSETDECYRLLMVTLTLWSTTLKCSSSSFRERGNLKVHLQPEKEISLCIKIWMHAWEPQKGLFISLLKIDILFHRDVKSFRVVNYSAAAVVNAHVGGSVSAVLLFYPEVKAAVSAQLPAHSLGDLCSPSEPAADRILQCFDYWSSSSSSSLLSIHGDSRA